MIGGGGAVPSGGAGAVVLKPWPVAIFERERAHMTEWVRAAVIPHLESEAVRRILIRAPVKSGKREIVEYIAMRDNVDPKRRVHAFVSAFHRVADESQRSELREHNLEVFSIRDDTNVIQFSTWLAAQLAAGYQVVIHLDECDYGAGYRQKMRYIWDLVRDNLACTVVLYSATPEEVLFSDEVTTEGGVGVVNSILNDGVICHYVPPAGYCGPARFLAEGLIHRARPFFQRSATAAGGWALSEQGAEILRDMRAAHASAPRRNMLALRLSYAELGSAVKGKQKKAFYQFLQGLLTIPELVGADDIMIHLDKESFPETDLSTALRDRITCGSIEWSNPTFWRKFNTEDLHIIVMDQTSTRSTEWACHNRLFAYHDYRNTVTFSTVSQAQERVNHYEQRYGGFQPIRVYGHVRSFQLSAGAITYEQFLNYEWEKRKVDRRTVAGVSVYTIRSTETGELHPEIPGPLLEADADAVLEELDCLALLSLSSRVKGSSYLMPVYTSEFHTVNPGEFEAFRAAHLGVWGSMRFQDPFVESTERGLSEDGRYKGYLREWAVFDYDRDIVPQPGWGIGEGSRPRLTICYKDGVLGIAVRYFTGEYRTENTLRAYRSMYRMAPAE